VFGSNVAVASPDLSNVHRKLRALDLLVVCDAFENETTGRRTWYCPSPSGPKKKGR